MSPPQLTYRYHRGVRLDIASFPQLCPRNHSFVLHLYSLVIWRMLKNEIISRPSFEIDFFSQHNALEIHHVSVCIHSSLLSIDYSVHLSKKKNGVRVVSLEGKETGYWHKTCVVFVVISPGMNSKHPPQQKQEIPSWKLRMPVFSTFVLIPLLAQHIVSQNSQYWFLLQFLIKLPSFS